MALASFLRMLKVQKNSPAAAQGGNYYGIQKRTHHGNSRPLNVGFTCTPGHPTPKEALQS